MRDEARRPHGQRGFTLLETMIASGILVLLLGGAVTGFVFCLSAASRTTVQAERRSNTSGTTTRFQAEVAKATSASIQSWGRRLDLKVRPPGSRRTTTTASFYTSYSSGGYNLYVRPGGGKAELLASKLAYPYWLFSKSGNRLRLWLWLRDEEGYYLVQTGAMLYGPTEAEETALTSR